MKFSKDFKIKDLIFKNFPLKILAVIIAVALWIVIVNVDNPSQRKTISGITVNLRNVESLTEKDYTYQVVSGSVISIVVKAPQSVVEELKAADFSAYADVTERSPDSDKVPIHVSCVKDDIGNQVDILSLRTEYVQLSIDNKVDCPFNFEVDISGTPAEDYIIGDYSISPTTIRVSGPEETVRKIKKAVLRYNVEGMAASIDDMVVPVFLDEDGKEINTDKLELTRNSIRLRIDILPTKWVPVNFAVTGEAAEGYEMTGYDQNLDSVKVAAAKDLLASLASIDIPAGDVDITGMSKNDSLSLSLSTYLPSGYRIVSSENTLTVAIRLEKLITSTVNVPVKDVAVRGMNEGRYEYAITSGGTNSVAVEVYGRESIVSGMASGKLELSADLTGLEVGKYKVPVNITANDRFTVNGKYYIDVQIKRIEEETTTEPETQTKPEQETQTTPVENTTDNTAEEATKPANAEPATENPGQETADGGDGSETGVTVEES